MTDALAGYNQDYLRQLFNPPPRQPDWEFARNNPWIGEFYKGAMQAPLGLAPSMSMPMMGRGGITLGDLRTATRLDAPAGPNAITGGSLDQRITDQWAPYPVPGHPNNSEGLAYYNWKGMRDRSFSPLPNPWPRYSGKDPSEYMMQDIQSYLQGRQPAAPTTPYDLALQRQQLRRMQVLRGGRRDIPPPAND